jgi:uncharacterized protein
MPKSALLDLIQVKVKGLMVDPMTNVPILILRADDDSSKFLPIWIGIFEANSIALQLEGVAAPRPLTHDLCLRMIEANEGRVIKVIIRDLQDSTFFADLILRFGEAGAERIVDARPSDAIALALRSEAPIFISQEVFDKAREGDLGERFQQEERLKKWLEEIDPEELGKYTM